MYTFTHLSSFIIIKILSTWELIVDNRSRDTCYLISNELLVRVLAQNRGYFTIYFYDERCVFNFSVKVVLIFGLRLPVCLSYCGVILLRQTFGCPWRQCQLLQLCGIICIWWEFRRRGILLLSMYVN